MNRPLAALLLLAAAAAATAQITISPPPPLPNGTVNWLYSVTFTASGGTSPYTYTVSAGQLPSPLTLDPASGQIAGTPDTAGAYNFTITATDSLLGTGSQVYDITIAAALGITTPSLPAGTVGTPYSFAMAATGGNAPLTWSIIAGSLPANLTLSASGTISGDPIQAGTFPVTIQVVDAIGATVSQAYNLVIAAPPPLVITTTSIPNGTTGVLYNAPLAATGGVPPYLWSATALPPGLAINPATGDISGTPTMAGPYSPIVTVTDSLLATDSKTFPVTIVSSLAITTTALPAGTVGVAYNFAMTAGGGILPYSWSAPALAALGLSINPSTGVISGTPTTAGTYPVTVTVTDTGGGTDSKTYDLTINPALTITTTALPNGTLGVAYAFTMAATGGAPPYTWSIAAGSLPQGLTLSPGGVISGTPTGTSSPSVTIKVSDGTQNDSKTYSLTINLTITTTSLPAGTVGVPYNFAMTAGGGTPPYTWSATTSLPAGLGINSAGVISGTPTTPGAQSVTIQVTDNAAATDSKSYNFTINPPGLAITTTSLPPGTVSAAYTATLAASGGTPPYTWSLSAGSLPPGVNLSAAGQINGMPITAGTFNFTVKVTDSASASATRALSITVAPPLTLTGSLANGVVNEGYSQTLQAGNGNPPYTFAVTAGTLPPGLALDAATGGIAGVPTTTGSYTFSIQVTDSVGARTTQAFTVTIAPPLVITTTSLRGAGAGSPYSETLTASGGLPPYSWSISSGQLPPGLTLSASTGTISGSATTPGSYTFTVSVTDSGGHIAAQAFTIRVASTLTITSTSPLQTGAVGTAYSQALAAISGVPPYTWAVTSGSLPPGISLNASTGLLSGTPTTAGTYTFTVKVTDATSTSVSATFSLTIVAALAITTTSLPGGSVGGNYSQTLAAVSGTTPYTWSVTVGSLPPGLTLDAASGVLSGKPTTEGTYTFTVQVKDAVGATATQPLTLVIAPALNSGGGALPAGVVGQSYSQQLTASGGTAPYTFAVDSGSSLPAGLSLSSSGLLSGTPSAAGDFAFTVRVTDSAGATTAHAYTLTISLSSLPEVAITGLSATVQPLQQLAASITLAAAYPIDLAGTLSLSFQPDAAAPADDAAIQFSTGGRTTTFSIPAGSTQAAFPGSSIQLQTGSTAGTITLTVHLTAAGADATPNPPPSFSLTIARSAPVIRSLRLVTTASGFEVWITGYSTSRELTQAAFQFTAASGSNLQTTSATVPLSSAAQTWYQDASSANYGSQFTIIQPFTVTGSSNAVASVSVTLSNAVGPSASASASF